MDIIFNSVHVIAVDTLQFIYPLKKKLFSPLKNKAFLIVQLCDHIWHQLIKYIEMSTNMCIFDPVVLEIDRYFYDQDIFPLKPL